MNPDWLNVNSAEQELVCVCVRARACVYGREGMEREW